jgi:heme/copper-type cytochrome/quinol oxidase subunit 2
MLAAAATLVVIFIAVFGVMFYSILKHRKSVGHKAANFHESVAVEIAWTVVPFIIVIGMGALATKPVVARRTPATPTSPSRPPATSGSGATTTSRARARASASCRRWT